jgi:hypothetical protein
MNNITFPHPHVRSNPACCCWPLCWLSGFGRQFYRTVIFMPTVLSVVIIGFIWQPS